MHQRPNTSLRVYLFTWICRLVGEVRRRFPSEAAVTWTSCSQKRRRGWRFKLQSSFIFCCQFIFRSFRRNFSEWRAASLQARVVNQQLNDKQNVSVVTDPFTSIMRRPPWKFSLTLSWDLHFLACSHSRSLITSQFGLFPAGSLTSTRVLPTSNESSEFSETIFLKPLYCYCTEVQSKQRVL